MKKQIQILFFFLFVSTIGFGQNCYKLIADMSGIDNTPYQSELETAACALKSSIPEELRDEFKIFDFGFYPMTEYMPGGFKAVWDKVITDVAAESEYYLVFGKQSDSKGIYSKFWVEFNLPFNNDCLSESGKQLIQNQVQWKLEDKFKTLGGNPANYAEAEISAMNFLQDKIDYLYEFCCNAGIRTSCTNCPNPDESLKKLRELNYKEISIDSFKIESIIAARESKYFLRNNNSAVDASSDVTVYLNGTSWHLNQNLENEINSFSSAAKGVIGTSFDFCLTELYGNIQNNYYESFSDAIIYILWTKYDETTLELLDKKLFIKEKYSENIGSDNTIINNSTNLQCYPLYGIPNNKCDSYALPNSPEIGQYAIKTDVIGSYHGYTYEGNYYWNEGTKTEYIEPLPQFPDDRDIDYNDCSFYSFADYSDYAKRQSFETTEKLVSVFEKWTRNNILGGQTEAMKKIIDHFEFGDGSDLIWNCDSKYSKYIYSQPGVIQMIRDVEDICNEWLKTHFSFNDLFDENYSLFQNLFPERNLPGNGASPKTHAAAAITIGGIQGLELKLINLKEVDCNKRCYEVEAVISILDFFGAGTSDRDRGTSGWSAVLPGGETGIPGLTQMWLLQHCRNTNNMGYSFKPFRHRVNMGHKFKICID